MHDFTGFEPVENTVEDISRLVQEVGLYEVIAEDATELSDSFPMKALKKWLKN
jgi:hypothetical protein